MRIATWNVNSLKARLPRVEDWLDYARPDVLCLQETKLADAAFPHLSFGSLGYESVHYGQGRWNGVAILSRVGVVDVVTGFNKLADPYEGEARLIAAKCGALRVVSVYVPNGREVGTDFYQRKLLWLECLREWLAIHHAPTDPLVVLGDFNVAPEDRDVWSPAAFEGATHVTGPERAALAQLREWGLVDLFRRLHGQDRLFTYWDYRRGDFHQHRGMRIDLAYGTKPVADRATFALVDRNARKGEGPSDHAPMLIDVDTDTFA